MNRSCLIASGVLAVIFVTLAVGAALWVRHEMIESERQWEARRARMVAIWIAEAKGSRYFHSGYDAVSPDEWRQVGELGHLESVSQVQCGEVDGRAMLEHVDAEAVWLAGVRLDIGDPTDYPANESVRSVGLTRVSIEGDLATFLAAMPRLETLSLARGYFPEGADKTEVLERGLGEATDLKSIKIDDERIADRLRERFPEVEIEVDRRSDDEIYP